MKPLPIMWGWRIRCCSDNCNQVWENWTEGRWDQGVHLTGPPPAPNSNNNWRSERQKKQDPEGWFLQYKIGTHGVPHYIALCPEHSAAGLAWLEADKAWNKLRDAHARVIHEQSQTIMGRVIEMYEVLAGRTNAQRRTNRLMAEWCRDNPRPEPKWETALDS